jgi:hypothetical protein
MTHDDVVAKVGALVAAGEYLDCLPGVPGARLAGDGVFYDNRRLYSRGSAEHLAARAAGLVARLPPLTPAPPAAVAEAEDVVGHPLPRVLRRLYLEVGNGGFGPGYGILGLRGGHRDDPEGTAVDHYRAVRAGSFGPSMPAGLLPLCHWGCGIYSLVDVADLEARMWGWDPNPQPDAALMLFRQSMTLGEWLGRWVDGRLYQPWLIEDPTTGAWRGATDADYAALMPEASPQ